VSIRPSVCPINQQQQQAVASGFAAEVGHGPAADINQ